MHVCGSMSDLKPMQALLLGLVNRLLVVLALGPELGADLGSGIQITDTKIETLSRSAQIPAARYASCLSFNTFQLYPMEGTNLPHTLLAFIGVH
jgi:hypothetical protein